VTDEFEDSRMRKIRDDYSVSDPKIKSWSSQIQSTEVERVTTTFGDTAQGIRYQKVTFMLSAHFIIT
jgi:hypothetical protein